MLPSDQTVAALVPAELVFQFDVVVSQVPEGDVPPVPPAAPLVSQ